MGHVRIMVQQGTFLQRLRRDQRGNVMYLTAGLILPIFATIGSGVDLGQAYMAKARLQQACDAGVLAGRKIMADGVYSTTARTAANNMFNFNYPAGIYDSTGVTFNTATRGASEVTGTATATVQTIIMGMFGKEQFNLTVNCAAKLEISNADIMFVLDTTGSMASTNAGDSVNKITALKTEVMSFFDTVADAQQGDAIIRYGVVPYSSNVNVGRLLYASNPSWMASDLTIPSRTGAWAQTGTTGPTTTTGSWSSWSGWSNTGTIISGRTSGNCSTGSPANTITTGTPTVTNSTSGTSPQTTTTTSTATQTETDFQYVWSSSACREQRRTRTRTSTTVSSVTREFRYTYQMLNYNTASVLPAGGTMTVPSGDMGADVTTSWNGCILERDTVGFDDAAALPSGAYDLDVDLVPNSSATRWRVHLPNLLHAYPTSTSPATGTVVSTTNYAAMGSASTSAACPTQAMKLTAMTSANRATFQSYINSLVAVGGTYHDVGMIWGTRLISPTGLFASENATAPNGMPISRHIIFMTDGEMAPNNNIYGFQGRELHHFRVGSTDTTEMIARHNRRLNEACSAAKARNITVWVVSFGTAMTPQLQACASGDKAYSAANNAQLRTQFQAIAQQITRLRLSE